jgi:hypothetical protein
MCLTVALGLIAFQGRNLGTHNYDTRHYASTHSLALNHKLIKLVN